MALTPIVDIFGIDSIAFFNRDNGIPYGRLRVLASSSLKVTGKLVELTGGSAKFPWDAQEGKQDAKLTIKCKEYPDFIFQLFGGGTPTENAADALGNVSTLTNKKGTSLMDAVTGIASVTAITSSEGDLKFGKYTVEVVTATTIMVYASYDTDFGRGTSKVFQTDGLKILVAAITITTGAATNVTGFGFKFTGGSGTIGMTVGDTATFEVRPKNSQNMVAVLGGNTATFPEFSAVAMAKRKSSGEMFEVEIFRAKGEGLPIGFDEDKFSEWDVNCSVLYDTVQDGIARLRRVTPLSAT